MAANTRPRLLDRLRDSGLLEPAQLNELAGLPEARDPDPRALARLVLQRGWLTRYQINRAAQGRSKELFIGPYVVHDQLGEGGMGQVYRAKHRHMGRVVALKVIRPERLRSPESVRRFYQEAQAAGQLHHPNIVLAYDAGEADGIHFLTMELVEGQDLARIVKEGGPLPVAQACDYIRQAAVGLQHAFERGMVHRDIKPHNLLVTAAAPGPAWGTVKILDLGLARLSQGATDPDRHLTQTGAVIGTPDYLAPEQALNSRAADTRSDLYSLGCTFYFLLTGRPPFHAETLTELLLRHQMDEPVPLEALRPDVPEEVRDVVRILMAKDPALRFQTPAELVAALGPYCSGNGTAPRPRAPARPAAAVDWATLVGDGGTGPARAKAAHVDVTLAGNGAGAPARTLQGSLLIGALIAGAAVVLGMAVLAVGLAFWLWRDKAAPQDDREPPLVYAPRRPVQPDPPAPRPEKANNPPPPRLIPGPPPKDPPPAPPAPEPKPGDLRLLRGVPGGNARALAFSPDGRRALIAAGRQVSLWNLDRGTVVGRLEGHKAKVNGLVFGADGKHALTGSEDGVVRLWDVKTATALRQFDVPRPLHILAASSDLRRAFTSTTGTRGPNGFGAPGDDTVHVWDVGTGKELRRHNDGLDMEINILSVSADGRRVLTHHWGRQDLIVWEAENGREVCHIRLTGTGFLGAVLSPDGARVLYSTYDRVLHLHDVATNREVRRFDGWASRATRLAFSANGRLALSGGGRIGPLDGDSPRDDASVRLWDAGTGKEVRRLDAQAGDVTGLAFAPDGRRALILCLGGGPFLLDLGEPPAAGAAEPAGGRALRGHTDRVTAVAVLPDGRAVTGSADTTVRVWDVKAGKAVHTYQTGVPITAVAVAPDGLHIAGGLENGEVLVWETDTGRAVREHAFKNAPVTALAFGVGKRHLVLGSSQEPTLFFQRDTTRGGHRGRTWMGLHAAAPSGEGQYVLVGGGDGIARLWHIDTEREKRDLGGHTGPVVAVALTPDSRTAVTAGADRRVWVWDLDSAKSKVLPGAGLVHGVAVTPDGRFVVTGGEDRTVRVWDARSGRELRCFTGHTGPVTSVAVSPDGKQILSASEDQTLRVWATPGLPDGP